MVLVVLVAVVVETAQVAFLAHMLRPWRSSLQVVMRRQTGSPSFRRSGVTNRPNGGGCSGS